jgi:methylmalonyl-CoA mutase N-terminal domain/subunit
MFDPTEIDKIRAEEKRWEEKTEKTLAGNPQRDSSFHTSSGIPIKKAFSPLDIPELDYLRDLNFPGEYPYTRGIQANMYRGKFWTMRQYAGYGSAEDTNRRYHYLLQQGQNGLSVAFDLPTQIGYDSDHHLAEGEVGKVGVAIDSVADMAVLFKGIPLDKVSTSMTINAPASVLLAMYVVVAEQNGIAATRLNGTIQNDILKEYSSRGTYIYPPKPSMRLITDTFDYCAREIPGWNPISISGYHMREAGCTAVQEVAFTLCNAIAYVEAALAAGLDVDDFGPRLSFFFNAHLNFLEEIAKFRAARRLWAKTMKERFGAKNSRSCMLRFHVQTAGSTLTAQQPSNNVTRVAWQALSAVLGGAQSLHTNSMDEALALPSEQSAQVALRTQQLIAYESGVADTVDPMGGSFCIEALTREIERRAEDLIQKVDKMGGAVAAVEGGYIQQEIQESAYAYQQEVESGDRIIVGVNWLQAKESLVQELLEVDPQVRENQTRRIAELKRTRNAEQAGSSLEKLRRIAQGSGNLMVPILECVRSFCTLGEICDTMREVFGEYRPTIA